MNLSLSKDDDQAPYIDELVRTSLLFLHVAFRDHYIKEKKQAYGFFNFLMGSLSGQNCEIQWVCGQIYPSALLLVYFNIHSFSGMPQIAIKR